MTMATVKTIEADFHRYPENPRLSALTGSNRPPVSSTTRRPGNYRSTSLQATSAGPTGSSLREAETTEADLVDGNATQ